MAWTVWLSFFAACWVIAISPGSGAVLSMSHGLAYGWRGGQATIAGLQLGLMLILVVAGAGVGSLLLASESAFWVVKIVGALYLMYLGLRQMLRKPVPMQVAPDAVPSGLADPAAAAGSVNSATSAISAASTTSAAWPSWRRRVFTGFFTNATNPKGILFMVAVLPQFIDPARPLALQLLILALTMCAVDMVVMNGYAASASALQRWLRSTQAQRWQNRFFGSVLMLMGAGLLMVEKGEGG